MYKHERVEGGEVFKSDVWATGIHSIVARCLVVTKTNGESEAAAFCAVADPCALADAESARDAARERDAQPKGASSMLSEALGCASWVSESSTPSGGLTSIERHVGLSAAQRFEHAVRVRNSANESSHPCRVVWPTCKTAMKIISVDGKRTEPARLKITPSKSSKSPSAEKEVACLSTGEVRIFRIDRGLARLLSGIFQDTC